MRGALAIVLWASPAHADYSIDTSIGNAMTRPQTQEETNLIVTIPVSFQKLLQIAEVQVSCDFKNKKNNQLLGRVAEALQVDSFTGIVSTTLSWRLKIRLPTNEYATVTCATRFRNNQGEMFTPFIADLAPTASTTERMRYLKSGAVVTGSVDVP